MCESRCGCLAAESPPGTPAKRGPPGRPRKALGQEPEPTDLADALRRRSREVLGEELLELVERDQVRLVVEVDVARVRDVVELLGLGGDLVDVLAEVARVRVLAGDEQDRSRRDPLDLRQQREVHERRAAGHRELGDRVGVVAARRRVELAELAADGVGAVVEASRRATRRERRLVGFERCSAIELRTWSRFSSVSESVWVREMSYIETVAMALMRGSSWAA